jgi:CysZ protein
MMPIFHIFKNTDGEMDFLHQIKTSLLSYYRTYRFIENHNLWKIFILPAIINLIITVVIVIVSIKTSGYIVELFFENIKPASEDKEILSLVHGLLMVIVRATIFFLYLKIYRYLILITLAPLFAAISSKVQTIATGQKRKACTKMYLMDCTRGIQIALRNFLIEAVLSTIIIVVSFIIAWIIPLAPILILILESWYVGYSFADYRNEHFALSKKESRKQMWTYPGLVLGNGLFFNILILIPIIGVLFAPVFALVSSGLSINHLEKRRELLCSSNQSTLMMADS